MVSITDDDVPTVTVSFEQGTYVATEGGPDATVTVELSGPAPRRVDILLTADGQGGATPTDWSGVPEQLTFKAGDTFRTFTLVAVDDEDEDDSEVVELGFGILPDGFAAGSPATARVTLINDDITTPEPGQNQCPDDSGERMVLVGSDNIHRAGESDFWRVELDPWRSYVIEVLGSDGGSDILGEANPGGLTLSDPHLYGVWSGDGSELIRRIETHRRARLIIDRGDNSGFRQFEVRSFGGNTGTYQIKVRVNNICVMSDGKAVYSYDGGPDGYTSDRPADSSTGDTFRLRSRPSENISHSFVGFLGDNWDWYWDRVPDEDWFAIEGVSEDYEYTINVETIDDLPVKHQATRLKILALYDSNEMEVQGTAGTSSGKKVSLTFQPNNTGPFYVSVGSDPADRTGVYRITLEVSRQVSVSFEMATYVAIEGGPNAAETVKLSVPAPRQVDILLTADGQGGATPTDWSGVPEQLTFKAGDTFRTFTLVAVDDEDEDDSEVVELGFGILPDGFAAGSPATARVTLMNNDITPPEPVRSQCPDDSGERMVLVGSDNIHRAGESDFWRVELDPWRSYVIEVLGSDGGPDILGEANPGSLTLSDPHLYAMWSGDGSELFGRAHNQWRADRD